MHCTHIDLKTELVYIPIELFMYHNSFIKGSSIYNWHIARQTRNKSIIQKY